MMFENSGQTLEKQFEQEEQINPAFQLSDDLVDMLLGKLGSDDEFRAVFQKNPRIALAYLGHEAASKANANDRGIWACMQCQKLASREAILASRDELRRQLLSSQPQFDPIRLSA